MKIFLTSVLLLLAGILQAQTINTIEYFFDTDPGVGSGSAITVNGSRLDSSIDLPITGLTPGIHILYTRLKNSNDTWGPTYQSPVLITNGTAGTATLTSAEYFFDTDPGVGNGSKVGINGAQLDAIVNFPITGLTAGVHTLYIRLKNANGAWGQTYQSPILITTGAEGTATILAAEYYFDTDPGFGNGQSLPVNKSSLDSVINFNVTGLTPGAHTIYVRLKNSNKDWSFAGQGSFILSNGVSGIPQVKSLEYFSNTDSGISKNPILPLNPGASPDTTISVFVADNNTDYSILGLRLADQTGQQGNVALTKINLCDLYKPKSGFRGTRFGNSYTFIDSTLYNPTGSIRWMVDNIAYPNYDNSRVFNYTFPPGAVGTRTVTQIVGTGCRVDTSTLEIQMLGVESFSPTTGYVGKDYELNIYGGDLDTTMQVYLQRGSTIITPYDKAAYQGKLLSVFFDLHNVPPPFGDDFTDIYDLHVRFSDGHDTVISNSIAIFNKDACALETAIEVHRPSCSLRLENDDIYVTADMTGPDGIRAATWNYYTLNVSNVSQALAKETPVFVLIPAAYDVQFDLNWLTPFGSKVGADDSLSPDMYVAIDTVVDGKRYQYKAYGIIPTFINPGQTWTIDFKIRTTQLSTDTIMYWVDQPMFGSPPGPGWLGCLHDAFGYLPVSGCIVGMFDYLTPDYLGGTSGGFPPSYHSDFSHGILRGALKDAGNMAYSIGSAAISCGGAAKAGAKALSETALKRMTILEEWADRQNSTYQNGALAKCGKPIRMIRKKIKPILARLSFDPNHIVGNSDYDDNRHYVSNLAPQNYRVSFENIGTASAPAQHVFIIDTLDPAKYVLSTFKFTGYRIGDSSYPVPFTRNQLFQTTGIKYYNDVMVQFVGNLDTVTGIVRIDFFTMDATGTNLLPETSLQGFLPPNTDGVSGTGEVGYSVFARSMPTGSTFSNKADIYFDANPPIATNTWANVVDQSLPTGNIVKSIPVDDSTVRLVVQNADIGSGVNINELFVKGSSDSVFNFLGYAAGDTITFTGTPNQTYQAFVKTMDNVGNEQLRDSTADISFVVAASTPLPVHLLSFNGQKDNTRVKLSWSAVNEVDFSRYDVERSADGIAFSKIGSIASQGGAGTNYYQYYDEHPLPASNFYRLREIDRDGSFTFSRVIRIDFDKAMTISLTPVPAQGYIIIDGAQNFRQVQLLDMSGRVVKQFATSNGNTFDVHDLPAGVYLVRLVSDSGSTTLRMIKS